MLSQLRATDSSWCVRQWATLSVALYLTGRLRSLGLDHSWGQCHHEMRRQKCVDMIPIAAILVVRR